MLNLELDKNDCKSCVILQQEGRAYLRIRFFFKNGQVDYFQ